MIELEIRTVKGNRIVGELSAKEGTYEHARVCQVLRSCCMKGFLDSCSNREIPQTLDEVRRTFCPGCHLRPNVCRGIE